MQHTLRWYHGVPVSVVGIEMAGKEKRTEMTNGTVLASSRT
jgi:hypothetical protein